MKKICNLLIACLFIINFPLPVFARCAVCYTDGLSGASIAVIVISAVKDGGIEKS